jgi:hypothetical protein
MPPADFERLKTSAGGRAVNPFPATSWTIEPNWQNRGLPASPPPGYSRLVGFLNHGASREREQWTLGAAASDRFAGVLAKGA